MSTYLYALQQQQFLSSDLVSLHLTPLENRIEYQAGQYVDFIVNDLAIPMSIANIPNTSGELIFHLRVGSRAPLTEKIYQHLLQNKQIHISPAQGLLHCQEVSTLIFIAGGTGISPCLPLIQTACEQPKIKNIQLFWGISALDDYFLQTTLGQTRQLFPRFHYDVVLSEEHQDWQGPTGLIGPYAQERIIPNESMQIILSGPYEMVQQSYQLLVKKGIKPQQIFSDMLSPQPA